MKELNDNTVENKVQSRINDINIMLVGCRHGLTQFERYLDSISFCIKELKKEIENDNNNNKS